MRDQTLVVIAATFKDGRDGFYLLNDHVDAAKADTASGEELLDVNAREKMHRRAGAKMHRRAGVIVHQVAPAEGCAVDALRRLAIRLGTSRPAEGRRGCFAIDA